MAGDTNYEDAIPAEYLLKDAKPPRRFRLGQEPMRVLMALIMSVVGLIFMIVFAALAARDYSRADALATAANCPRGEDAVFADRDCVSRTVFDIPIGVYRTRGGEDKLLLIKPDDAHESVIASFTPDDVFDAAVGEPPDPGTSPAQQEVGIAEAWRGEVVAVTTGKNSVRPGVTVETTLHPDNRAGQRLGGALIAGSAAALGGIGLLVVLPGPRGPLRGGRLPYLVAGMSTACAVTFTGGVILVLQPGNVLDVGSAAGAGWVALTAGICFLLRRRLNPHTSARQRAVV